MEEHATVAPLVEMIALHPFFGRLPPGQVSLFRKKWEELADVPARRRLVAVLRTLEGHPRLPEATDIPFEVPWTQASVEAMLRHGGGVEWSDDAGGFHVLALMSVLPASWLPKDEEEFEFLYNLSSFFESGIFASPGRTLSLMRGVGGRWREFAGRLGLRWPVPINDLWFFETGISDTVAAVRREIVEPCLPVADPRLLDNLAMSVMSEDEGLASLATRSKRWHLVHATLPGLSRPIPASWPALAGAWERDGLRLVFLDGLEALRDEGEALDHCVRSYATKAAKGYCHIASVRTPDGEGGWSSASTVEFSVTDGLPIVFQHRGRGNAEPDAAEKSLVLAWIRGVVAGDVRLDPEALRRRVVSGRVEPHVPAVGTPADWSGILGRRWCRMGWDGLIEGIRTLAADKQASPIRL